MFKSSRSISHVSAWILFFIPLFIHPCMSFSCMHDKLNENEATYLSNVKFQEIKTRRDRDTKFFESLRIHFYVDNIDESVSSNVMYNVELALREIKVFIEQTFQVRKRKNPFLLERQGCSREWQYGKNKGKCAKFTIRSEICAAKEVYHEIPPRFLDKVEIYDFDGDGPRYGVASGPGLLDSNFIAFVTSQSASFCEETDVAAYGTYCRLHPKTNEPLAGILNLCPNYFSKKNYAFEHYYNVMLHEVLHILGFSINLFEKFLPCEKGMPCNVPMKIVQEDENEIPRMMFPLVIENAQKHFNCSKTDFGGPMAKKPKTDNSSNLSSSHWHPVLMYSSIMSPSFSEYEEVFVDNLTLSVFASTGWYRVNFTKVDKFEFGEGQGCDFGLNGSCNSLYLCNPGDNTTGCDLAHESIGRCTSLTDTHPCGIYQPYEGEICESRLQKQFEIDFHSLGYKQKCFMLEEPESQYTPSCLPVKCKTEDTYEIMVNMTWYPCQTKELVLVQNASIMCPDSFLFCPEIIPLTARHFCPVENNFFIAVRMYFKLPTFEDLSKYLSFKNFKVTTLRGIAKKMEVPINYVVNASLSVFKTITLDFAICPPPFMESSELNGIVDRAQKFLDGGDFMHLLKGQSDDAMISSSDINIDPAEVITFSDHEGFKVLLIFPIICAIFLLATFVASILRLILIRRYKPQRASASQNPDNI